jgi:hypothetical protein
MKKFLPANMPPRPTQPIGIVVDRDAEAQIRKAA